jgi:hypothetical protein
MKVISVTIEERGKSEWVAVQGITYEETPIFCFSYTLSSFPLILAIPNGKLD